MVRALVARGCCCWLLAQAETGFGVEKGSGDILLAKLAERQKKFGSLGAYLGRAFEVGCGQ